MFYVFSDQVWIYYIAVTMLMAPTVRIFIRAGFKPYWAFLLLLPWVGYIICTGVLALRKWPAATVGPLAQSPGEYQP